jgi:hypothetical protein
MGLTTCFGPRTECAGIAGDNLADHEKIEQQRGRS